MQIKGEKCFNRFDVKSEFNDNKLLVLKILVLFLTVVLLEKGKQIKVLRCCICML